MLPQPPPQYTQPPPHLQQPYIQNIQKPMSVPINQSINNQSLNSNPMQFGYTHVHGNENHHVVSKPTSVQVYPSASLPNGTLGGLNGYGGYSHPLQINNTQSLQGNTQINTHFNTQVNQNNKHINPNTHPSAPQVLNTASGQEISFGNAGYLHGELYSRILQQPTIPSRPSYHFFGSEVKNNSNSRSIPSQGNRSTSPQQPVHNSLDHQRNAGGSIGYQQIHNDASIINTYQHPQYVHQQANTHHQLQVINQGQPIPNYQQQITYGSHNQGVQIVPAGYQEYPQPITQTHIEPLSQPVQYFSTTTIVWEHKFVEIYTNFEMFVERFEVIVEEIYLIDDLFENVNDEEAWNDLRVRYTDMIEKFNEMKEEIIYVLEQNKSAVNSLSPEIVREIEEKQRLNEEGEGYKEELEEQEDQLEEGAQTGNSENHVWENRCLELMQQHEQLTKENNAMKEEIERLRAREGQGREEEGQNKEGKFYELQKNFNTIHVEYQKLEENYNKVSEEYSRVLGELQRSHNGEGSQTEISELQQQLELADAKIQELYEEIQKKDDNIQQAETELENYAEIHEHNKNLIETANKLHHEVEIRMGEIEHKNQIMEGLQEQVSELTQEIEQLQLINANLNGNEESPKLLLSVQELREKEKEYLNVIEKLELTVEQVSNQNQQIRIEWENKEKEKDDQIKLLNKFLDEERTGGAKGYLQGNERIENIVDTKIFKERLQIEIEETVAEKNRKIKSLTEDIEDVRFQLETIEKDKSKSIKEIKLFFSEEEEKYIKKIQDKDNSLKQLQERLKSFESELANRNLEISRFRHQSPTSSFNATSEETKKFNEVLDKKNHEMQQLRRSLEQKALAIRELEQKIVSYEQDINGKIYEVNSLKREVYDLHGNKAEIDNLNNIIKKKNQELNEARLSEIEIDQLKLTIDSLEREKIRTNEYLKEKTRESESKDNTIQSLERKINTISLDFNPGHRKVSDFDRVTGISASNNYESMIRQKETEIKNLRYELEMLETKISISEKTIRDLNSKISTNQRSSSVQKAEIENKITRNENEIKELNKEIRSLKSNNQELTNIIESLNSKNNSLEKCLQERDDLFDREITNNKTKITENEKVNTLLTVDQEILKNEIERLTKDNKTLNNKIILLQEKIETKNNSINEIKINFHKKEREDMKSYEEKMKKLDNELKFSTAKLKNMEEEISKLNKKITSTENEKRSYKERLITESSNDRIDFIDLRYVSEHYESVGQEILEMEKFKLKDPEANDVFERKVIYELKRENDVLRRELSGIGGVSSYSVGRVETHHNRYSSAYQQDQYTERAERDHERNNEHDNEILEYHKNKNKELEGRIDELLSVNNALKDKLALLSNSNNSTSTEFYKTQISQLESEIVKLQNKIKQILGEYDNYKDEVTGHQHQNASLNDKISSQTSNISELKNTIRNLEHTISQLENKNAICQAEIERLKETCDRKDKYKDSADEKDRHILELNNRIRSFEEEISKLTNRIHIQSAEIERLQEEIRNKRSDFSNQSSALQEQSQRRIQELERQVESLRNELQSMTNSQTDLSYRLELLRSYFSEIDALVSEIPQTERRTTEVLIAMREEIEGGFRTISSII